MSQQGPFDPQAFLQQQTFMAPQGFINQDMTHTFQPAMTSASPFFQGITSLSQPGQPSEVAWYNTQNPPNQQLSYPVPTFTNALAPQTQQQDLSFLLRSLRAQASGKTLRPTHQDERTISTRRKALRLSKITTDRVNGAEE